MSRASNKKKILTSTPSKIIIRDGELPRVFNKTELQLWHDLVNKIRGFDREEEVRINLKESTSR